MCEYQELPCLFNVQSSNDLTQANAKPTECNLIPSLHDTARFFSASPELHRLTSAQS